jgi:cytochrome P450 family 144
MQADWAFQLLASPLTVDTARDQPEPMAVLDDPIQLFGDESIQDPYHLYDRMRSEAPVHRIGQSAFYAVCSWDAVVDCVNRVEDFSSNLTATMVYQDDGTITPFTMSPLDDPSNVLAVADDPDHAVHRRVLVPHLSAKRIRDIESFAASTADRLWRENVRGGRIEWMSAMANRLPMMVVARLIGVPDDDVDQLIRWAYATTTLLDGIVAADQLQAAGVAVMELGGYVLERFERAATNPADNLLGDLASRCASGELDQITARGMMLILFGAGGESTASLLGSATWILATHPEIQREVRDDLELLGPFIEEALRYEPPFRGHYRHVRNDTTLGGVELPADSHLLLMWGAANRDPDHFESPDEFRLDRRTGKGHITFGKGAHFCVGAPLARLEAQIVLGQLLERTSKIEAAETGRWLPSLLVRRLEHLKLAVK